MNLHSPTDPSLGLLHDVAAALLGAPLEIEPILAQVTALTVPRLADLAMIYLLRDDRTLERLAIVHSDAAKAEQVRELQQRYPPDLSAAAGLAQVLRSGRSEVVANAEQHFAALLADDQQRALVGAIGPRSYITVALRADGAILGALQLVITESDRQYTGNDLVIAETVAARCALALRNARLHQDLREAHAHALAARERAEGALAERDRFLAAAAHELRTPLTALLGNAQLLRRRTGAGGGRSEREAKMLDALVAQALRLSALISNLMTVAELDAGQLVLGQAPVDLCGLARRVIAELEPFADRHSLVCEAPEEEHLVRGDEIRLHAMLEVMLRSTLLSSPPGGEVTVRVRAVGAEVELAVVVPEESVRPQDLPHIFERYYRAPGAEAASSGGLGINLWLARELARRHDGDLVAEIVPGGGTALIARLPQA